VAVAQPVQSGDQVTVFNAQLNGPSGLTNGKLVVVGDRMVFVDDERPQLSFAVDKADVRRMTLQNGELSVDLGRPVTDRWGQRTNLILRTDNPQHIQNLIGWAGVPLAGGTTTVRTDEAQDINQQQALNRPGVLSFDAVHDHAVGNCSGKLLVGPDGLRYESVTDRDHSRSWSWSQLEGVDKNTSEHKVIIKPRSGDHFTLKLGNEFDAAYNAIADRMVAAQTRR
jgi:hypothetical protein